MRFRLWTVLALALSLLGGSVALAGSASAARVDCKTGYFCFWVDSNFAGPRYNLGSGDRNSNLQNNACGGCISSTNSAANGTWNEMASSWYNHTSTHYCIYTGTSSTGVWREVDPNGYITYSAPWNDRMSSVKPARYRPQTGTIPADWLC
jgi:hypothetical protein